MNRLKEFLGEPPEEHERDGDYWEIESRFSTFYVSAATAREVERVLERQPVPRWVVFSDLVGARHRLLIRNIERVSECRSTHREAQRAFDRARRLEEKADRRPWEED
jgi:hypothetical protein